MVLGLVLLLAQATQDDKAAEKAAEKAAADAVTAFDKAYKGSEAEKLAAIEILGKTPHLKTANRLALVIGGSGSENVRVAAVQALAKFTEQKKSAATVLAGALGPAKPDPGVFWAVCGAIAQLQEPSGASGLAKYFDDKDENVARVAIECAGKAGCSVNIDALIALAAHCEKIIRNANNAAGIRHTDSSGNTFYAGPEYRPRNRALALLKAINEALKNITSEPINTSDGWSAWWSTNKATFGRK